MSVTVEYGHLVCQQKFSSVDYYFVYDYDENNVVVLIQTTQESEDIP